MYFGHRNLPPKHVTMDEELGTLHHVWTDVKDLRMYSLVSVDPAPPGAPAIVLVHGSGLSGRYMLPTARQLTADFRVYVPICPASGTAITHETSWTCPSSRTTLRPGYRPWASIAHHCSATRSAARSSPTWRRATPTGSTGRFLQRPTTPPEERSWFWQLIRWRQNQRINPPSLNEPTRQAYRKVGAPRMFWSFREQITDRIEAKAPLIQAPVLVVRAEHDPVANQRWCR